MIFNLTTEPWIVCTDAHGNRVELSLRGVFARAHELRALSTESPLTDAAIFRLLLAILHRSIDGPQDSDAWAELYLSPRLPLTQIEKYLGEWKSRFDLFHPETPFLQVAGLLDQSKNYPKGLKPARELIAEQSSYGTPRELFESRPDDYPGHVSPAQAARWLLATQAFHPGGLLSRDTSNGDPTSVKQGLVCKAALVAVQGENLHKTLVLNLVDYPLPGLLHDGDRPNWESPPAARHGKRACRGLLDLYTWQSRRMLLVPDEDGNVGQFLVLAGNELDVGSGLDSGPLFDPQVGYRRHEKFGFVPVGVISDRALWRDSTAFYQLHQDDDFKAPLVLRTLARRMEEAPEAGLGRFTSFQLRVDGQTPDQAKIIVTRTETLGLPTAILRQPPLTHVIRTELERCEKTARELRSALFSAFSNVLSIGERSADAKDIGNAIDASLAMPLFWTRMKPAFDRFLAGLSDNLDESETEFRAAMRSVAERTYRDAVLASSKETRALKGFALGQSTLNRGLFKVGLPAARVETTLPTEKPL